LQVEEASKAVESLDTGALRELRELTEGSGHPEQFRDLVVLFLDGLEPGLASMHKALEEEDAVELATLAHGFKGTSASMGAMNLASLCVVLEEAAAKPNFGRAQAQLKQIESEVRVVRWLLERETRC
jgi:HPt (histidine-containing phosphotransfer) domain-containing protein